MGRIVAPFGVQGWVRVEPYTAAASGLLAYPVWWVEDGAAWREHVIAGGRLQGRMVVARIEGCADRNQAEGFRGRHVAVPREKLPEAGENEYYWADLIGLKVVNEGGLELGEIARIMETGANDVLVVEGDRERLIPFIANVIAAVDVEAGLVRVNWDADY